MFRTSLKTLAVSPLVSTVLLGVVLLAQMLACSQQLSLAQSSKLLIAAAKGKKPALPAGEPLVIMDTNKGQLKFLIYRKDAPVTAGNFLDLVQKGFYNGLSFHRYEAGFLIQGGDPRGNGEGFYVDPKTNEERKIPLEIKATLRHQEAGMLAMAHAGDPNSASCQFYITLAACPQLDERNAIFGKLIDGMPVLMNLRKGDKITKASVQEASSK